MYKIKIVNRYGIIETLGNLKDLGYTYHIVDIIQMLCFVL